MKKIFRYFLQGLLIVAPSFITIYIVWLIFRYLDQSIQTFIVKYLDVNIPGMGILALLILITLLGFLGQSIIFKPLQYLLDKLLANAPLVKVLYSAVRDLFSAFVGDKQKFNKPVLVKVNMISGLEKIGFLTTEDLSHLNIKDKVSVYFPHSYNFSGEMFIVPIEHITPLNITPSEAMKFIVSGGVTKV
jgi:uncharacterized membrane protein